MRLGDLETGLSKLARRCWRKERHASPGKAEAHLRSILRSPRVDGATLLTTYQCRYCKGWHIGHDKTKESK